MKLSWQDESGEWVEVNLDESKNSFDLGAFGSDNENGKTYQIPDVEFTVQWEPRPYNIYWTMLLGYPALSFYCGAN